MELELETISKMLRIEPDEIQQFLTYIPEDQKHLKLPLALKHFFKMSDSFVENLEDEIAKEAEDIIKIFPQYTEDDIKNRLNVLGNTFQRKEVILRLLVDEQTIDNAEEKMNRSRKVETFSNNENNGGQIDLNVSAESSDSVLLAQKLPIVISDSQKTHESLKLTKIKSESSVNSDYIPWSESQQLPIVINDSQETNDKNKNNDLESQHFPIAINDSSMNNDSNVSDYIAIPESQNMKSDSDSDETSTTNSDDDNFRNRLKSILEKIEPVHKQFFEEFPEDVASVHDTTFNSEMRGPKFLYKSEDSSSDDDIPSTSGPFAKSTFYGINLATPGVSNNGAGPSRRKSIESTITKQESDIHHGMIDLTDEPKVRVVTAHYEIKAEPEELQSTTTGAIPKLKLTKRRSSVEDSDATVAKIRHVSKAPETISKAPISPPLPSLNEPSIAQVQQEQLQDEAAAYVPPPPPPPVPESCPRLISRICEVFPDACPDFVRKTCAGKSWNDCTFVIETILQLPDYPKRQQRQPEPEIAEISREEQFEIVKAILPDADPNFLRIKCESFEYNTELIMEFLDRCRESKDYPTLKHALRKQQLTAQAQQYTSKFDVAKFVELFPDPEKAFNDPKRKPIKNIYTKHYINRYFSNRYNKLYKRTVDKVIIEQEYMILATDRKLQEIFEKQLDKIMKTARKKVDMPNDEENILVLQELAYLTHKQEITDYIEAKKREYEAKRLYAKENGLMGSCQCCFDDEVMPEDVFNCPKNHGFCRECMNTSCGVALGEGKTDFKCLSDCPEEFTLRVLQNALPPKMFSKLAQKKTLAELKAAGIEELETCPFCDFATIPVPTSRVFRCLNPDCMKESCRECKEPSHLPLRCDEIEKDEHVKVRTHIEDKMTEALLRTCYKCGKRFFKEEGCNKMRCPCGATMCYVCNKGPVAYEHFNGIGGDKKHLCPLYTDTHELNKRTVLEAANAAKAEVDASKLKYDPTADIEQHFQDRRKVLGAPPYLVALQDWQRQLNQQVQDLGQEMGAPVIAAQRNDRAQQERARQRVRARVARYHQAMRARVEIEAARMRVEAAQMRNEAAAARTRANKKRR